MNPEQSNPEGVVPPQWYGVPRNVLAKAIIEATLSLTTTESFGFNNKESTGLLFVESVTIWPCTLEQRQKHENHKMSKDRILRNYNYFWKHIIVRMPEIDISKLTKLYYSIGEVAKMLGVNSSLLRFWEKEFSFQIAKKNAKGNRMYGIKEIAFINHVYQLVKVNGFTLEGAKQQLKVNKVADISKRNKKTEELIKRLESMRERIIALKIS